MKEIDIKGRKYGHLTAIEKSSKPEFYIFKCDCGKVTEKRKQDVTQHKIKSCGCMKSELVSENKRKHGCSKTKLYWIWCGMKGRCYNKNYKGFKNYGGRGIIVCDEWKKDFKTFNDWALNNGYIEGLSIERINVNGNYYPENCKWISVPEQSRNKTVTVKLNINDEEILLKDLCKKHKIKYRLALDRYRKGYSIEDIFSESNLYRDKAHFDMFTYNGKTECLAEWCKIFRVKYSTAWARLFRYNKTFEETFGLK